jgi:uncharacterized membrane protein
MALGVPGGFDPLSRGRDYKIQKEYHLALVRAKNSALPAMPGATLSLSFPADPSVLQAAAAAAAGAGAGNVQVQAAEVAVDLVAISDPIGADDRLPMLISQALAAVAKHDSAADQEQVRGRALGHFE